MGSHDAPTESRVSAEGYVLGMDIGGTHVRMGLVDRTLEARHVVVLPSASLFGTANVPRTIAETIRRYCHEHLDGRLLLVAAGFPSVIDRTRRRLYSSTNFPGLDGVDVVSLLEEALRIPVIIEHDAYYLLAFDIRDHGLENDGTMLGFYFGTGLGNGMYIGGAPYVGRNGTACEVGHMPVGLSEEPCSCGNRGCVEMYCCGKRFERLAAEHFPDTPIGMVFARHGGAQVLDEFVRHMALPIATEVNVLDPDAVFVGGGLVQMKSFPRARLEECVLRNTRKPYPAANLRILFSRGSPENGVIGAGIEGFRALSRSQG